MRKMTLLAFALLFAIAATASAADKNVHVTKPLDPNGRVSIDTHNGSVTVTTWNRPEVDVQARVESGYTISDSDVQATQVRVTGSGASVDISTDYSGVTGWGLGFFNRELPPVRYTISVPATAQLKVSTHNAETRVRGLRNDVEIDSHNGGVTLTDIDGAARVETHNGDIQIAFARFAKNSRIETHNGSIEVRIPQNAAFRIDADGHHLSFDSDFATTTKGYDRDRFTGDVNGGGPALRISTHNGSVRIRKS